MSLNIASIPLTSDLEWDSLEAFISPEKFPGPLKKLLSELRELGATSAIVEHEYLDRDFTAEFCAFYAKLFARYTKVCRRIHFFKADASSITSLSSPLEITELLTELGRTAAYLGFLIVRPVSHAPIGRTVIRLPAAPQNMASKLLVRAMYDVHLLGASLQIEGYPLIQQDTRVGACAQAAIWSVGRHFYARHRGPWTSVNEITQEALTPFDLGASISLPAGSSQLSLDGMVRALRKMGQEPFTYVNPRIFDPTANWAIDPVASISRYVDSGIPVILGLSSPTGGNVGHAVVAVGYTAKTVPGNFVFLQSKPSRSVFCEALLVNDDQRGAYIRLPLEPNPSISEAPFNIRDHLQYIIIPLPSKVFLPAESAEEIAWDILRQFYVREMPKLISEGSVDFGQSTERFSEFVNELSANRVIARTYLTFGWKYRMRMVRNSTSERVKQAIIRHDLPRYVWVTEFGTLSSMNYLEARAKRIQAHVVVDATSSQFHRSALFFHAPGLIKRWVHNGNLGDGRLEPKILPVKNDVSYFPKARGRIAL
jgi:hypothetical protein